MDDPVSATGEAEMMSGDAPMYVGGVTENIDDKNEASSTEQGQKTVSESAIIEGQDVSALGKPPSVSESGTGPGSVTQLAAQSALDAGIAIFGGSEETAQFTITTTGDSEMDMETVLVVAQDVPLDQIDIADTTGQVAYSAEIVKEAPAQGYSQTTLEIKGHLPEQADAIVEDTVLPKEEQDVTTIPIIHDVSQHAAVEEINPVYDAMPQQVEAATALLQFTSQEVVAVATIEQETTEVVQIKVSDAVPESSEDAQSGQVILVDELANKMEQETVVAAADKSPTKADVASRKMVTTAVGTDDVMNAGPLESIGVGTDIAMGEEKAEVDNADTVASTGGDDGNVEAQEEKKEEATPKRRGRPSTKEVVSAKQIPVTPEVKENPVSETRSQRRGRSAATPVEPEKSSEMDSQEEATETPDMKTSARRGRSRKEDEEENVPNEEDTPRRGRSTRGQKSAAEAEATPDTPQDAKATKRGKAVTKEETPKVETPKVVEVPDATPRQARRGRPRKSSVPDTPEVAEVVETPAKPAEDDLGILPAELTSKTPRRRAGRVKQMQEGHDNEAAEASEEESTKATDMSTEKESPSVVTRRSKAQAMDMPNTKESPRKSARQAKAQAGTSEDEGKGKETSDADMKLPIEHMIEETTPVASKKRKAAESAEVVKDNDMPRKRSRTSESDPKDSDAEEMMDEDEPIATPKKSRTVMHRYDDDEMSVLMNEAKMVLGSSKDDDIYNIDQIDRDENLSKSRVEKSAAIVQFVEVETIFESPGRRSVLTQTDPRLKKKKFGPIGQDSFLNLDDLDFEEETPKRVRGKGDNVNLFEDVEQRRKSIKRNTEEALKCPFCDRSFIGLVKHIKSKHNDEPDFDEEMRNAKWRERIMKVATQGGEEGGETCDECGKVTKNMKRHMESHQLNRMQIPCPMCGKVVLKTGMSSHMRTVHSGSKPYKCPHCDYSSAFRGNLNTHVKGMHLHTRQYLCTICKAAFKTLGALIGHTKRVHEGWKSPNQKIFICSVCEKRFTKKYHVDRHMLIHTGEKPHKCNDCGRSFNNKSNLMSHVQLVHKKLSPYQCDVCNVTFKRKKMLLEHIGKLHVHQMEHLQTMVMKNEMDDDEEEEESMDEEEEEEVEEEGEARPEYREEEQQEEEAEEYEVQEDPAYQQQQQTEEVHYHIAKSEQPSTLEEIQIQQAIQQVAQVDPSTIQYATMQPDGTYTTVVTDSETMNVNGQTITTLQTEGGQETIIIVHTAEGEDGETSVQYVQQIDASQLEGTEIYTQIQQ